MVQKKVPNKLGIKDDHVKTERGLLANLKQSSSMQHDGKNKGADLKKKMKKSKSIKRSDFETFRSPTPPPGKLPRLGGFPGDAVSGGGFLVPKKQSPVKSAEGSPPLQTRKPPPQPPPLRQESPGSAASGGGFLVPKKQSSVKSAEGSPNYMKSTSSFEARKERSPVSTSRSPQTSISPKTPSSKNLITSKHKSSSSSSHKASSRTLSRTSSLKLVRTLTKSPSFKPSRALSKKCSPVGLCEDFDTQRATCSSTLKDSKFPNYLTLNPGATEAEGTSAVKVCPYTYCSLNGHRHAPLPPLKCFLSARRRVLKTQKSFKLACLSPRRAKPKESELKGLPIMPLVQEESGDFFIEIYTKDSEKVEESGDGEIVERVLDESTCLDADFGKNQEMDTNEFFSEEDQFVGAEEEVYSPSSAQEDKSRDCFIDERDKEEEGRQSSTQLDEVDFDGSDMDWEAGEYSEACIEDVPVFESDKVVSSCCLKELVPDEVMEVLFDEESVGSEAWFDDGDSESGRSSSCNLESYTFQELTNKGDEISKPEETIEEPEETSEVSIVVLEANDEMARIVDDESRHTSDIEDEDLVDHKENESPQDNEYSCLFLGNQESDSPQDFLEQELHAVEAGDEIEENESLQDGDYSCLFLGKQESDSLRDFLQQELPAVEAGDEIEENESPQDDGYSCLFLGNQESDSCQDFLEQELPTDEARDEMKESDSSQTCEDNDESNEAFADEGPENASNKQFQCKNVIKNQEQAEKDDEAMLKVPNVQESQDFDETEVELVNKGNEEEKTSIPEKETSKETKNPGLYKRSNPIEESLEACKYPKWGVRGKKIVEESDEERKFNPREPNYLPVEPDEDAEKVDLRHQMVDERKNAEEWMVDYALRQAVTSLAPARKRKVALLVEAFETVMPIPKYESHMRHTSSDFALSRPIQACR